MAMNTFGNPKYKLCCRSYQHSDLEDGHNCFCDYIACFDNSLTALGIIPTADGHGWLYSNEGAGSSALCETLSGH